MSDNWKALEGKELADQLLEQLTQAASAASLLPEGESLAGDSGTAQTGLDQGAAKADVALDMVQSRWVDPSEMDPAGCVVQTATDSAGCIAQTATDSVGCVVQTEMGSVGRVVQTEMGSVGRVVQTEMDLAGAIVPDGSISREYATSFWNEGPGRSPEEQKEIERLEAESRDQAARDPRQRRAILEAVLFAAAYPVQIEELVHLCGWSRATLEDDLEALAADLEGRGLRLQRIAGGCRLVTAPDCAYWVENYLQSHNKVRLSRPQMETLAIVAYNQPVTRAIVDTYRGVHSERVLAQLEDLHLIREVGRASLPGRPILLGTTSEFLRYFALDSLDDLPQLFTEDKADEASLEDAPALPQLAADSGEEDGTLGAPSDGLQKLLEKMRRRREREAKASVAQTIQGDGSERDGKADLGDGSERDGAKNS